MQIKNIIFDLGGVILNLDHQKTINAFKKLGAKNAEEIYVQALQDQWLDDFEIGKINAAKFRELVKSKLSITTSDIEIDAAWNAMLCDIPKEKLDFIKLLRQKYGYKTFLMSNTNELHLKAVREIHGANLSDCFDKEYYSNEMKARKPNTNVFITIITENHLNPNETLFLDDSLQHIEAAKQVGLHAQLISQEITIFNVLEIQKNQK